MGDTLTVTEVAQMLRVSRQTVYNFAKKGTIPFFKVGTKVRFHRSDIEELMKPTKSKGKPDEE